MKQASDLYDGSESWKYCCI